MAAYTAIIGDTASVGAIGSTNSPGITEGFARRNRQVAVARVRSIQNPHIVSSSVGGLLSADFLIPAEEALRWRPSLRYGAVVWLFDGSTPIFYGWAEQPVWTAAGDCQMSVSGPWLLLGAARMREAWEILDMSLLNPGTATADRNDGNIALGANGSLRLAFSPAAIVSTDRVSVEYLLFGEAVGTYDGKLITAFEFDISDNAFSGAANLRFRVIGCTTPGATGTQLYDTNAAGSSGRQGAYNLAGVNQSATTWGVAGYRCLRFQLVSTGAFTTGGAAYVVLDRIRISTREALFPAAGSGIDTGKVARDVIDATAPQGQASADTPQEFWLSHWLQASPDANTLTYAYGGDPVTGTGTAPNSGFTVAGFSALEWQNAADILAELAAIDGSHVGFYLPYGGRGGYDPPGNTIATIAPPDVGSWWLSAPPQLVYQQFPDPIYAPDYTIYTREGARVEPSTDAQPLIDRLYANYQTIRGRQLSVVTGDSDLRNYAYAQGFARADDYSVQPPAYAGLATTIGQQQLATRRQPHAAAQITIENDGQARYPILKGNAAVPKLALVRPGSMRIDGVAASSGLRAGYATQVEWWGQTPSTNEKVTITLGQPGQVSRPRAHGKLAHRLHRERRRLL